MVEDTPNFDFIARLYRWLEYFSFGPYLEHARFHFLDQLTGCRHALVLGDGDGRLTARLLATNPQIHVDAVDASAAMLRLLSARAKQNGSAARLQTIHSDALKFASAQPPPPCETYDLVVTHFFLDCLSEAQIAGLLLTLQPRLAPDVTWVVSEFAVPSRQPMRFIAGMVVGALYRTFRVLTGLQTQRLPDHAALFRRYGFDLCESRTLLRGLLVCELWKKAAT